MILLKKERINSKARSELYEGGKQKPGWAQKYRKKLSAFGVESRIKMGRCRKRENSQKAVLRLGKDPR